MKKIIFTMLLSMFLGGVVYAQESCVDTKSEVEAFVTRFYSEVLDRSPDSAGLDNWVTALLNKSKSGADIAKGFIFSTEFTNRNIDNDKYLEILYKAFFNRAGDSGGLANWKAKMNDGKSKSVVLDGFLNSKEFENLCEKYTIKPNFNDVINFVTRFYQKVLNRNPDTAGLNNWVKHLTTGTKSGADIAKGFIFSTEFTNRGTNNDTFLDILYKSFFNRVGDTGGVSNWTNKMNNGISRTKILDGFLNSTEFENLCKAYGIKATDTSIDTSVVDKALLEEAKLVLEFNSIMGENTDPTNIETNLKLISSMSDYEGVTISWSSNDEETINPTTGIVTQPEDDNSRKSPIIAEPIDIILTAILSKNGQCVKKEINLTVVPKS